MSDILYRLAENRTPILLAEMGAYLHLIGRFSEKFIYAQAKDASEQEKEFANKEQFKKVCNDPDFEVPPENWTGDNIHFERGYEKMGRNRKYSSKFKAEVALEAIKGDKTISQIASEYGIHPQQVRAWKKEFLENMHLVFEKEDQAKELKKALDKAYKKIGQLEVERDFLSGILKNY